METVLRIKSKVDHVPALSSIDLGEIKLDFHPDLEKVDKDINRMLKAKGKKENVSSVENSDLITVSCSSDISKYNKKDLMVPVGAGFFSKELEEKIIGCKVGEPYTVSLEEGTVNLTVSAAQRTIIPELSDATAESLGLEGVSSVTDLRKYFINRQIEGWMDDCEDADMAAALLWQNITNTCTFDLDPEEEADALRASDAKIIELNAQKEKNIEEMGEEQVEANIEEYTNGQSMEEMIKNMYILELKSAVLGYAMLSERGELFSMADYEDHLQKIKVYFPDLDESALKEKFPLMTFIRESYADYLARQVDDYIHDSFKKILNP